MTDETRAAIRWCTETDDGAEQAAAILRHYLPGAHLADSGGALAAAVG